MQDASITRLVRRIDSTVASGDPARICPAVKSILTDEVGGGRLSLPAALLVPSREGYARRL